MANRYSRARRPARLPVSSAASGDPRRAVEMRPQQVICDFLTQLRSKVTWLRGWALWRTGFGRRFWRLEVRQDVQELAARHDAGEFLNAGHRHLFHPSAHGGTPFLQFRSRMAP